MREGSSFQKSVREDRENRQRESRSREEDVWRRRTVKGKEEGRAG